MSLLWGVTGGGATQMLILIRLLFYLLRFRGDKSKYTVHPWTLPRTRLSNYSNQHTMTEELLFPVSKNSQEELFVRPSFQTLNFACISEPNVKPRTDEQFFAWQVSWQVYFVVCTTNNFSLTAVHTNKVSWLKSWHDQLFNQAPCQGLSRKACQFLAVHTSK